MIAPVHVFNAECDLFRFLASLKLKLHRKSLMLILKSEPIDLATFAMMQVSIVFIDTAPILG
jgi:hypothetical protein